jgi:hypothetical protein
MVNSIAARLVSDWKLEEKYPIFSDHCVISLRTKDSEAKRIYKKIDNSFPRWNFKKIDVELLRGYTEGFAWG